MLLGDSLASARSEAFLATQELYLPEIPFPTNLWCIKTCEGRIRNGDEIVYFPVIGTRNPSIESALKDWVGGLHPSSVEYFVESDYLGKYNSLRNPYIPDSLFQQADVDKWFLGGSPVPETVMSSMRMFWRSITPNDYKVLTPGDIKCPKYESSAGVCMIEKDRELMWRYCTKGPNWNRIQMGTEVWLSLVAATVPDEWITRPIINLISAKNLELEALALERPVIRKEGGPGKVRWARSSSGNVYILGRMFIERIQDGMLWADNLGYIGKAQNSQRAALKRGDEWYVGTHGDDWIAWCPVCRVWHSGDWSNWDLHVRATSLLASYQALFEAISSFLSSHEVKLFYALAYLAIRCPTIWPWAKDGRPLMSIRRTLGKVRSGSGDFILHNNVINRAWLEYLLNNVHERVRVHTAQPCRSKYFWPTFSDVALLLSGMVAKPAAQFTHPHGYIACRCYHTVAESFIPRPCVTSVIRNYVNPAYDPLEFPNNSDIWMVTRFRELNKTMAWSPAADAVMEVMYRAHIHAGVKDPFFSKVDTPTISRMSQLITSKYSTRAYLEGQESE